VTVVLPETVAPAGELLAVGAVAATLVAGVVDAVEASAI
jgi:hypothetical protein